jgi:hypothetical protein
MALYQWKMSYSGLRQRRDREWGMRNITTPTPFNPLLRHFMIGLIAKFVNAVGGSDREGRHEAGKNKCNENLCSTGHHNVRNANYELRPNQMFEWLRNISKYRVKITLSRWCEKSHDDLFAKQTRNNKIYKTLFSKNVLQIQHRENNKASASQHACKMPNVFCSSTIWQLLLLAATERLEGCTVV